MRTFISRIVSPWIVVEEQQAFSLPRYLAALFVMLIVTAVLWPLHDILILANFSLLYTLAILIIAIGLGTGPSLLAVAISFFIFDYFLLSPRYTFGFADPGEVADMIIFLLVALITGQLAAFARKQAASARQHAEEQQVLYRLSSAFNQLTVASDIYATLEQVVAEALPVQTVRTIPNRDARTTHGDPLDADYLLLAGRNIYGTLQVTFSARPTESQRRLLEACATQTALALHRIDLAKRAQRNLALEEADRLKTALLHAISHDLRTPITIIKTSAHMLDSLDDRLGPGEKREMVEAIEEEVDQLDKLVGNLLDLSRLQAGAMPIRKDWNELSEIAGDVALRAFRRYGKERIHLQFSDPLPLIRLDHGLLLQAVGNLAENALRYEPEDSHVIIRGFVAAEEVGMAVISHGQTIPDEEKELIMKPFYRLQREQAQTKGRHVGLGLAISQRIVEAHGGRLWVEDTPGGGATFLIALPREETELELDVDPHR